MLEELLNCQEYSRSILIIDDINNDASLFFYSLINRIINRGSHLLQLYPCYIRTSELYKKFFSQNVIINDFVESHLFTSHESSSKCFFKKIFDELDKQMEIAIKNDQKKSSYLLFENINLVLRHFNNNPFKLLHFVLEASNRLDTNAVIMLVHKDSVDRNVLNQIISTFQTVINVKEKKSNLSDLKFSNKKLFKYDIQLTHKNIRSSKVKSFDESVYLDEAFTIEKIEKHIKKQTTKNNAKTSTQEEEPLFKDLTFNVHLNDSDIEAKKNLILPYEIIGQSNPANTTTTAQQKMANAIQEDSKIYYAPDETDDVDDDDPDDDLNF